MSTVTNPRNRDRAGRTGLYVYRVIAYFVLIVLSLLCLFFFYVLLINATRNHADIQKGFSILPGKNFTNNWNSLVAILSTYFSALTAYAIHAYDFKLKNFAFKFILLIMMVPSQVSALGFVKLVRSMGLMNTFLPLFLPSIAAPAVFFFMKQYMDSVLPMEIIEAARIDGSGEYYTFNAIILPIMKPAIAVQAIFTFVGAWNNYFTPALILKDKNMKTLPILIAQLRSADWLKFDMGQVYMAIALAILPIMVVYFLLSRFIVAGVTLGSVKG